MTTKYGKLQGIHGGTEPLKLRFVVAEGLGTLGEQCRWKRLAGSERNYVVNPEDVAVGDYHSAHPVRPAPPSECSLTSHRPLVGDGQKLTQLNLRLKASS